MSVTRLLARARRWAAGSRRTDLCVAAYCHAFSVEPEAVTDGGEVDDDR